MKTATHTAASRDSNRSMSAGTTATPQTPTTVAAKYDPENPPQGWTYINYRDQPGGGFRCGNCNAVEDGNDVDGHSCG